MLDLVQPLSVPHIDSDRRFDLSPDGEMIAFSWNKSGSGEIYTTSLRRSPRRSNPLAPKEIASSQRTLLAMTETLAGSKFSPQYSPGGNSLAFALDLDGNESYHIVLRDFKKNKSKDLLSQSGYAHQPNSTFSPDGSRLAILSDEKGQFALYVVSLALAKRICL